MRWVVREVERRGSRTKRRVMFARARRVRRVVACERWR